MSQPEGRVWVPRPVRLADQLESSNRTWRFHYSHPATAHLSREIWEQLVPSLFMLLLERRARHEGAVEWGKFPQDFMKVM